MNKSTRQKAAMDISNRIKSRSALRSYFVKNAIPTESNFAEFIDSVPNARDDGLVKGPGEPLNIEASEPDNGQKRALNFYWDFAEDHPHWILSLNPRAKATDPSTARPGFSIGDNKGLSRLFIDRETGNLGVSTINPAAKLDITGGQGNLTTTEGDIRVGNEALRFKLGVTLTGRFGGDVRIRAEGGTNRMMLGSGTEDVLTVQNGKVGVGTTNPSETLHVSGRIMSGSLSIGSWPASSRNAFFGTSALDQTKRTNYALLQSDNGTTSLNSPVAISLRIKNDTRMEVSESGNVGIGTAATPEHKLTVSGSLHASGGLTVNGNLSEHVEVDGSFYRQAGSVFITVDKSLFIRLKDGSNKFHFDTKEGIMRQSAWRSANLANSWVRFDNNLAGASYFKDSLGVVHLRGVIKNENPNSSGPIFRLSPATSPAARETFIVATSGGGGQVAAGRVDIDKDGRVLAIRVNKEWVSLSGITFRAAD